MFVNVSINLFDEMLRIFTFGFMLRVIVSNNQFISNIYNSPCRLYSNIWTCWNSLLHINRVNLLFAHFLFTSVDFYEISCNLVIRDVDTMYTDIFLVVFIQCLYLFCDYIWTMNLQ